jgi:hypothetical protein
MEESAKRKRNRANQELPPLKARLERAAKASREAAQIARSAEARATLLRAARQYEVAAHLDEWLSSPGLQRPT